MNNANEDDQRTPVERMDYALDLVEAAMDEIGVMDDSELTFYLRQAHNKIQRRRRDLFELAKARLVWGGQ